MVKLTMQRSQNQIATTYAPDKHFTFEGGVGACRSVPIARPDTSITRAEKNQIHEGVLEFIQNWLRRATVRLDPPVQNRQALDDQVFLDHDGKPGFDGARFEYCKPDRLAYRPDPLLLVCANCSLVHEVKLKELAHADGKFRNVAPCEDASDGVHEWRQLDVVFAHWSGRVDPLSPFRKDSDANGGINQQFPGRCAAGLKCAFKLHKGRSGKFRDWYFHCHCGEQRGLIQKDEYSLKWLHDRYVQDRSTLKEINMLPVSYRANSLYYVQSEQMISYESTEHIDLMADDKIEELTTRLLKLYDYPAQIADDEAIIEALQGVNQPAAIDLAAKIEEAGKALATVEASGIQAAIEALKTSLAGFRQTAFDQGWIKGGPQPPAALSRQIRYRSQYARKFDPIRLGVEHETLRSEQLDVPVSKDAISPVVDLTSPDEDLQPSGDSAARLAELKKVILRKTELGFTELKLLRNLNMLQYSFGYSRVSATPTTMQKHMQMPVRLCGFPKIDGGKRPIYVLRQSNEALYIKLDEARVRTWLIDNGLGDDLQMEDGQKLGGRLIELYNDFGRFAETYSETTGRRERDVPVFVFGLLHTLSHQLIHACSKYSGLDLGSFGERIFPADLAFVIYRKGMTPDLGNIAAMWRNYGLEVLSALDHPRALRCGSGSLCDHRGGACPACIMIPEVSCVAGNNILSRAFLGGGPAMAWDTNSERIKGFFEI